MLISAQLMTAQLISAQRVTGLIGLALAIGIAPSLIAPLQATAQDPPAPPQFGTAAIAYRVVVDSADAQTLQQARQVDREAFIQKFADNRDRIQAGAFANFASATERVDALARVGVRAVAYNTQGQAVYPSGQTQQPYNPTPLPPNPASNPNPTAIKRRPQGYYAIVPVDRDQVGITFEAFRKLGIAEAQITFGEELRGWHVGVGVYSNRKAAESMSQFLRRKGGFDARTYYEP